MTTTPPTPKIAGGLPELPAWMDDYKIPCDAFDGSEDVRLSDRLRAYGELCRAAPAGGDDWPFVEEIGRDGKPTGYWIRKGSPAAARVSAPAGSATREGDGEESINIPKAQALIAAVGPGYRVIYRDAFRWKDENGYVLPNHYECHTAPHICDEHGHELVLDLGYAAILRDKRTLSRVAVQEDRSLLTWAVERWHAEVAQRPLVNVHRRSLDDVWRQVIRRCGEDDVALIGPRHDDLVAASQRQEGDSNG